MKTARERWLAERDHLLFIAEIGNDGIDDPWMWKCLFWWATPDLWDDEQEEKPNDVAMPVYMGAV